MNLLSDQILCVHKYSADITHSHILSLFLPITTSPKSCSISAPVCCQLCTGADDPRAVAHTAGLGRRDGSRDLREGTFTTLKVSPPEQSSNLLQSTMENQLCLKIYNADRILQYLKSLRGKQQESCREGRQHNCDMQRKSSFPQIRNCFSKHVPLGKKMCYQYPRNKSEDSAPGDTHN